MSARILSPAMFGKSWGDKGIQREEAYPQFLHSPSALLCSTCGLGILLGEQVWVLEPGVVVHQWCNDPPKAQ
jgi:hypothetical protein